MVEEEKIVNLLAKYFASVYEMNKDDGYDDDNNGDEIPCWRGPMADVINFKISYDDTLGSS